MIFKFFILVELIKVTIKAGLLDLSRFLSYVVPCTFVWAAKSSLGCLGTLTKGSLTITAAFTPLLDVGTKCKLLSVFFAHIHVFKGFYFYLCSLGSSLKTLSRVLLAAATWDQELYETSSLLDWFQHSCSWPQFLRTTTLNFFP